MTRQRINGQGLAHVQTRSGAGIVWCFVCQCCEGELLTYCPGFALNGEARLAIHSKVIDMFQWMLEEYKEGNHGSSV